MKNKIIFIAGLSLFFNTSIKAKEKPNMILIIADDVSFDDIGCYGNKGVKTPNIDRIANEGIRFENAYLTSSSSSPSRCSIITGRYPHSIQAAELHSPLPEKEIPFPLVLKENNYYTAQAGKWHLGPSAERAFHRFITDSQENGDGGQDKWIQLLQERPKDKPFFFWLASYDAHRSWGADSFHITHNPDSISVPVYFSDTPETRKDMASYYNEIARFDYFVGKVREELEKQGVFENTVIIIMADNGRPFPRCKTRLYDSGIKTPFIVSWPEGIKKKGNVSVSLISSIDIAPTLLELAGISKKTYIQGESFFSVLNDPKKEIRSEVNAEHNWHDYEAYERMVRTKEYLYIFNGRPNLSNCGSVDSKRSPTQHVLNALRDEGRLTVAQTDVFLVPRPYEELYDVKNDPLQLLNLASVSQYQQKIMEMRKLLKDWQRNTFDTMPNDLTPDWFDRETGEQLITTKRRGTMPGY